MPALNDKPKIQPSKCISAPSPDVGMESPTAQSATSSSRRISLVCSPTVGGAWRFPHGVALDRPGGATVPTSPGVGYVRRSSTTRGRETRIVYGSAILLSPPVLPTTNHVNTLDPSKHE